MKKPAYSKHQLPDGGAMILYECRVGGFIGTVIGCGALIAVFAMWLIASIPFGFISLAMSGQPSPWNLLGGALLTTAIILRFKNVIPSTAKLILHPDRIEFTPRLFSKPIYLPYNEIDNVHVTKIADHNGLNQASIVKAYAHGNEYSLTRHTTQPLASTLANEIRLAIRGQQT